MLSPTSRAGATLALALALALATPAGAQTAVPAGRLLASNCFQCHGTYGRGPGFDRLTGESASEIYKELLAFRSGKEGRNIMAAHALAYTDAQLRQLADWLSRQR
jgi:cytochrome c553